MENLSLRSLAASLDLAPERAVPLLRQPLATGSRDHDRITGQVHEGLRKAAGRKAPEQAIRALVRAYIRFAHEQKHFYDVFLRPCAETPEGRGRTYRFVELCSGAGRTDLRAKEGTGGGIALWAFLHGFVGLANAGVFDRGKPRSGFDWGLQAWFRAARG